MLIRPLNAANAFITLKALTLTVCRAKYPRVSPICHQCARRVYANINPLPTGGATLC